MNEGPQQHEPRTQTELLPADLGERFLTGTIEGGTPFEDGPLHKVYRCFEGETTVPGIEGPVTLRVDVWRQDVPPDSPITQMRFGYFRKTPDGSEETVAGMWFMAADKGEDRYDFNLVHREVSKNYRIRAGVGSSLYRHAEAWAQQVANTKREPVRLIANSAQKDVISWFIKNGYLPEQKDAALYTELQEYPDRFETETRDFGKNDFGVHIVRENMLCRIGDITKEPVRINLRKTLTPS